MLDGVPAEEAEDGAGEVVENLAGTHTFQGSVEMKDPMRPAVETVPAPEGVPEKFWDANKGVLNQDALLASYKELEKKVGQPKADDGEAEEEAEGRTEEKPEGEAEEKPEGEAEEKSEGETEEKPAGEAEEKPEGEAIDLAPAMEAAQAVYAETGDLSPEARDPFIKAGFSNEQIDLYIAGVKAQEAGLKSAAVKAAGVDDYAEVEEAVKWAADNWTPKKIAAFNAQAGDVETVGGAVATLFRDYRAAEPGEGQLANINSGTNRGDVYSDRRVFDADLQKADLARDPVARKAAIDKLSRSIKAKSLKN